MTSGLYTTLGARIWDWEPFVNLDSDGRVLWLALYTTPEAKRIVPGLFHGSINTMSESARMSPDLTIKSLDTLLDRELVEFDSKNRVLRLTKLPDPCESPANGNMLRGWWKRFCSVPPCQVRDAHVATVRWLMDTYARENAPKGRTIPSHDHEEAWSQTFGTVPIPASRRRGVRRLADSDTGTAAQPGLFTPRETISDPIREAASSAATRTLTSGSPIMDTPSPLQPLEGVDGGETVPRTVSPERPVDNSDSVQQNNDLRYSETVRERFRSGSGSGSRSSLSDPDPEPTVAREIAIPTPEPEPRPHLALVPSVVTFTPQQLVDALSQDTGGVIRATVPTSSQDSLRALAAELEADGVTLADLRAAGSVAMMAARRDLLWKDPTVPADEKLARWCAVSHAHVWRALSDAREHHRVAAAKQQALAENMAALGFGSVRPC